MDRVPLKRNRSPSPDDQGKPTILRPEKKKPKLMASGNPPPSAGKQCLLRLLHRQKAITVSAGRSFKPHRHSYKGNCNRKCVVTPWEADEVENGLLPGPTIQVPPKNVGSSESRVLSQAPPGENKSDEFGTMSMGIVPLDKPMISLESAASKESEPGGSRILQHLVTTSQLSRKGTGVICLSQRQSEETGNVDSPSGEPIVEPLQTVKHFDKQRTVRPGDEMQSFLAWKSRLLHMQRLRRLRCILQYELKRAIPRKKKDNAKIKYKLKTSHKEQAGSATTHAADSSSFNGALPAMPTDNTSRLGTGDAVSSLTFSNATVMLVPDTPPCLPAPTVRRQTLSSEQIISNNRGLPPTQLQGANGTGPPDSEITSNVATAHLPSSSNSKEITSTEAAPSSDLSMQLRHGESTLTCESAYTPPSATNVFISTPPPGLVEAIIVERNMAVIPASEHEHKIPASTFHLQCVDSRSEFARADAALPTVVNIQDIKHVSPSSSIDPVPESQSLSFGNKDLVHDFPVTLDAQAESPTLSAPTASVLPLATPISFLQVQQSPKHQETVGVQHIRTSKAVPHLIGAPPSRSTNISQTTDMPQGMDVDILNDIDSDFEGDASDLDNQARSGIQEFNHTCNDALAKIMEMLAAAKSPTPRLPKGLRGRGQARQYDVPRANNELKTCVREYAHHLLGQMPWDVPLEGELLAFDNGRAPGPTAMSFRLDLASRGLASRWNAQAAEIFADAFLNEDELAREFSDRDAILSAFVVHLTTLQKHYLQPILHAKMTEAEINGERDKQKQKAREQRKRGLFRRRINATKDYEADPLVKNLLTSFWPYCTPEVMSDDETDAEWDGPADQIPHFIKVINWRNPNVIDFFRVFDALYFSTRFQGNKSSPGRFPHKRVPLVRLKECDAVPGLPVNFYSPQWLLQLSDVERRKLNTRPAIDLDFSQNVLRIAARFLHVRQRKQLPLPRGHPALQGITRSTHPAGFPLDDRLHRAPNVEVVTPTNTPEPNIITVPAQRNRTSSCFSQPNQEDTPQPTIPALTRLPAVSLVRLPGENSSGPQFFFVKGGSRFPGSYAEAVPAGSGSTQLHGSLHVPTHPPQPLDVNFAFDGDLPRNIDRKPFTLRKYPRKYPRNFIKKGQGRPS